MKSNMRRSNAIEEYEDLHEEQHERSPILNMASKDFSMQIQEPGRRSDTIVVDANRSKSAYISTPVKGNSMFEINTPSPINKRHQRNSKLIEELQAKRLNEGVVINTMTALKFVAKDNRRLRENSISDIFEKAGKYIFAMGMVTFLEQFIINYLLADFTFRQE